MATAAEATTVSAVSEGDVTSGRVKWFNNKAGYGFISVPDCETGEERDMFVHHSEIKVEQSQYKYLVQGEYVEFIIAPINRENKTDVHATSVRGINGGKLMCETRNEVRSYRTQQGSAQQGSAQQGSAQQGSAQQGEDQESRSQGQGPRPQSARPSSGPRQTSDKRPQDKRPQDKRPQDTRPQTARPQDNQPRRATSSSEPRQASESKRPQLDKADQTEWMVVPRRRAETVSRTDNVTVKRADNVKSKSHPPRQRQPEIEIA
jgi:cold shock CspA family protein